MCSCLLSKPLSPCPLFLFSKKSMSTLSKLTKSFCLPTQVIRSSSSYDFQLTLKDTWPKSWLEMSTLTMSRPLLHLKHVSSHCSRRCWLRCKSRLATPSIKYLPICSTYYSPSSFIHLYPPSFSTLTHNHSPGCFSFPLPLVVTTMIIPIVSNVYQLALYRKDAGSSLRSKPNGQTYETYSDSKNCLNVLLFLKDHAITSFLLIFIK